MVAAINVSPSSYELVLKGHPTNASCTTLRARGGPASLCMCVGRQWTRNHISKSIAKTRRLTDQDILACGILSNPSSTVLRVLQVYGSSVSRGGHPPSVRKAKPRCCGRGRRVCGRACAPRYPQVPSNASHLPHIFIHSSPYWSWRDCHLP